MSQLIDNHRTAIRELKTKLELSVQAISQFSLCGFLMEACELWLDMIKAHLTAAEDFFDIGHAGGTTASIADGNAAYIQMMDSIIIAAATKHHLP